MIRHLLFWPSARTDVLDHAAWLAGRSPASGHRFLHSVEETALRLASSPRKGRLFTLPNQHLAGIRSWPVRGFESILFFYRPVRNGIDVVRVLHGARDLPAELAETPGPPEEA